MKKAHSGWVWFKNPDFPSRTLVRIKHGDRGVTCECRILDDRDVTYYNDETHGTRTIDPKAYGDVLVANDWYRTALGVKAAHKMPLTIASLGRPPLARLASGLSEPGSHGSLGNATWCPRRMAGDQRHSIRARSHCRR